MILERVRFTFQLWIFRWRQRDEVQRGQNVTRKRWILEGSAEAQHRCQKHCWQVEYSLLRAGILINPERNSTPAVFNHHNSCSSSLSSPSPRFPSAGSVFVCYLDTVLLISPFLSHDLIVLHGPIWRSAPAGGWEGAPPRVPGQGQAGHRGANCEGLLSPLRRTVVSASAPKWSRA